MCGIAGFYVKRDALWDCVNFDKLTADLLYGIDHRGGDATGYAAVDADTGAILVQKAGCDAREFLAEARLMPWHPRSAILHTRLTTQGNAGWFENNHPVVSGDIHIVHNGVIWNDSDIFRDTGVLRQARVDSEAIAALIRERGWQTVADNLSELHGTYAVAALNAERPNELLLAKGADSPLVLYESDSIAIWASLGTAIETAWRRNIGTPPRWTKFQYLHAGTVIRYANGVRHTETFEAYQPWQRYTESAAAPIMIGDTSEEVGERLERALKLAAVRDEEQIEREMEADEEIDSATARTIAREEDEDDPELRCSWCNEWFSLSESWESHGDLLCTDCYVGRLGGMVIR